MKMSKFLVVTFSDNSRWKVPAKFIARDRAAYYAKLDSECEGADYDEVYKIELDFMLDDNFELTDWAANNMNWSEVLPVASRLPDGECDYGKEWTNADMKVMELEG